MKINKSVYTTFALISQLGISMIVPIFLCTLIGVKLDEKYGWATTIPLILVGVLAGARNVFALVKQASSAIEAKEDAEL